MSMRVFLCTCQKCGTQFDFTGNYEKFREFLDSKNFACVGGHTEIRSPRAFVKVIQMSEPAAAVLEWKPTEGRNYVDILDSLTARIKGMQIDHLGSGLYIDRRTMKRSTITKRTLRESGTTSKYHFSNTRKFRFGIMR